MELGTHGPDSWWRFCKEMLIHLKLLGFVLGWSALRQTLVLKHYFHQTIKSWLCKTKLKRILDIVLCLVHSQFPQSQKFCLQLLGSQRSGIHLVVMSLHIVVFVHGEWMCIWAFLWVCVCVCSICVCIQGHVCGSVQRPEGDVEHPALSFPPYHLEMESLIEPRTSFFSGWASWPTGHSDLPLSTLLPVPASCSHRWLKCGLNSDLTLAWKGPLTQWCSPEPSQSWRHHCHL